MTVRGFDPQKVTRESIPKIVLLHGDDKEGVSLRVKRFAELLPNAAFIDAQDPAEIPSLVLSSSMFGPIEFIADVSCLTKKDSKSRKAANELVSIFSDADISAAVMFCSKEHGAFGELKTLVERAGGLVREVSLPSQWSREACSWVVNLAASQGISIEADAAKRVLEASGKGPKSADVAAKIVSSFGQSIQSASVDEMREWADSAKRNEDYSNVFKAIASRDEAALRSWLSSRGEGGAGIPGALFVGLVLEDLALLSSGRVGIDAYTTIAEQRFGSVSYTSVRNKASIASSRPATDYLDAIVAVGELKQREMTTANKPNSSDYLRALVQPRGGVERAEKVEKRV